MLRITFGGLGSFGLKAIRNRQVASSTLALGSNIPLEDKDLADSLNCLCPIRCKVVTNSEVFARRIHRAHLRFIHALDVNVLSYPDVAVAKNRLDGFVVHAEVVKVCRDTPAKCVPARASGEGNCHVDRRGLRVCAHPPASCKRCSAKAPAQWRASRGYRGSGAFQFHLERSGRLRVAPCVAGELRVRLPIASQLGSRPFPLYANCFWIPAIRYPTRNRTPRRVMEAKKRKSGRKTKDN